MSKNRVFASFNDEEFSLIKQRATEQGLSISKLVEYAVTLYIDMPRTATTSLSEIKSKISDYLSRDDVETFICSTPFAENWAKMTLSDKRTAAAQIRKLVDDGVIEKVDPKSKSHRATVYRKIDLK